MSFDKVWFNELRNITQENIDITQIKEDRTPPLVSMLYKNNYISHNFLSIINEPIKIINNKYKFDPLGFRSYANHIFIFPPGRAFRKQWNIGFSAGSNPDEDYVRIGIGFYLNRTYNEKGWDDYIGFMSLVKQRSDEFDRTFNKLGNYAELGCLRSHGRLPSSILQDLPNRQRDWRFFGKCIRRNSEEGQELLNSIDRFVQEAVSVFDHIRSSGFGL